METKKSEHANLESKRLIFRELGCIIGLFLLFMVFEYSISSAIIDQMLPNLSAKPDQELVVVTKIEDKQDLIKPKPILTPSQTIIEVLKPQDADTIPATFLTDTVTPIHPNLGGFEQTTENEPFFKLEKMPEFNGGVKGLLRFISNNLEYPQDLVDMGIKGIVVVMYVVDEQGKVKNPTIKQSSNPILNQYALDVVSKIPDYTPGMQNGKAASVYMSIPIEFKIQKN